MDTVDAEWLRAFLQVHEVTGAADAGHHDRLLDGFTQPHGPVGQCELDAAHDTEVATAGAPLEIVLGIAFAHACANLWLVACTRALIRSASSRCLKGRPVYWVIDSALTPSPRR